MKNRKHGLRILGACSLVVLSLILVVFGLFHVALFTEYGQKFISKQVTRQLSDKGLKIELGDITGDAPSPLYVEHITLSDQKGKILTLSEVELDWSPYPLLRGEVLIRKLGAKAINLHRLPEEKKKPQKKEPFNFEIPSLPIGFKIDLLDLPHIDLKPLLAAEKGRSSILAIKAQKFGYNLISSLWGGNLSVTELGENKSTFALDIGTFQDQKSAKVEAVLKDGGQGLLAFFRGDKTPLNAKLSASGRKDDWQGNLKLKLDRKLAIDTDFTIDIEHQTKGSFFHLAVNLDLEEGFLPEFYDLTQNKIKVASDIVFKKDRLILKNVNLASPSVETGYRGNIIVSANSFLGAGELYANALKPVKISPDFTYEGENKASLTFESNWKKLKLNLDALLNLKNQESIKNLDVRITTQAAISDLEASDMTVDFSTNIMPQNADTSLPVALEKTFLKTTGRFFAAESKIDFTQLNLAGEGFSISGNLQLKDGEVSACDLKGGVSSLESLLDKGEIALKGSLDFKAYRISLEENLKAEIQSKNLNLNMIELDPLVLNVTQRQGGDVELDLNYGREVARLTAAALIQNTSENFRISAIKISDLTDQIVGEITINSDTNQYEGYLKGALGNIAPFTKFIGSKSGTGKVNVDCTFKPIESHTDVRALLKLRDIKMKDVDLKLGIIRADTKLGAVHSALSVEASLFDGIYQDWAFKQISVALDGQTDDFQYSLNMKNLMPSALTFDSNGFVKLKGDAIKFELSQLKGRLFERQAELVDPLVLDIKGDNVTLSPSRLKLGYGNIEAYLQRNQKTVDTYLKFERLPLALIEMAAPTIPTDGEISGDLIMKGDIGSPHARFNVSYEDIDFALKTNVESKLRGQLSGGIDKKNFSLVGEISSGHKESSPLKYTVSAPLAFNTGWPALAENADVKVTTKGTLNLEDFVAFWPLENDVIKGRVDIDLSGTGKPDQLAFKGFVNLSDGYYGNGDFGTEMNNLSAKLIAEGSQISLKSLSATAAQGTLEGYGVFKLSQGFPYKIDFLAKSFPFVMNDEMEFEGNAEFHVENNEGRENVVRGTVEMTKALYNLPKDISPELRDIFDVEEEVHDSTSATKLDIDLNLVNPLLIKGWGVEATWRGNLKAGGYISAPTLAGKVLLHQGDFDLLGPIFKFTKGEITFVESEEIKPLLDIRAETEKADLKVILSVTGNTESPKIQLLSQPSLPQEEILSRLLFSESSADLSPYQALKIAAMANSMSGANLPLLGQIETIGETLGFDSFDIGSGESGGVAPVVKLGKRISNRVKASFEEDVEKGKTQGKIEVEVSPSIVLETGVSSDGDGNIGLVGKWEY